MQIASLSTTDFDSFTSGQIAVLTSSQIGAITTAQAHALTSDDVPAIDWHGIGTLSTAAIAALDTTQFHAMTTTQIHALTSTQFAAITTTDFASLSTDQLQSMTASQAHALTTAQIVALVTSQIAGLTTLDIAALTSVQFAAFESTDIQAMSDAQIGALLSVTPIALDLNGNGIQTIAAANGVNFDVAGVGDSSHKTGWIGGGDALLVRDRNGDGVINDGSELYGMGTRTASGGHAGNGYAALAQEDTNHDGKVTAADAHFSELKLWVDANHDGKTDAGELKGLADFGIVELDLNFDKVLQSNNGNMVSMVSSYVTADGAKHEMADVWLTKDAAPALGDLLAAPHADLLPGSTTSAPPTSGTGDAAALQHHAALHRSLLDEEHKQTPLI